MRYHHRIAVFQAHPRKVLLEWWEKKTDKAGLDYAKQQMLEPMTGNTSTFALLKPDAHFKDKVPAVINMLHQNGFQIRWMKLIETPTPGQVESHLRDLKAKNPVAYERNLRYLTAGPVTALEIRFLKDPAESVSELRAFAGPTDPAQSQPGQLRNLSNDSLELAGQEDRAIQNIIHTADSEIEAVREHAIWFA
jgi:nucleoside diphosphate kinase